MKKMHCLKLLSFVSLLSASLAATAETTIYQHGFNGAAQKQLGGTTTDVGGGTWTNANGDNSSSFRADGSVVESSAASGIWLPVTVEQGNIYTLSADVDLTAGKWLSLGYSRYQSDKAFFGSGGYGTAIVEGRKTRAFAGIGTGGNLGTFPGAGSGVQQLQIVLDTTDASSANWTMEFLEDGVSEAGPVTAESGDYGDIRFIGFTTADGDSTGKIENLKLTVKVSGPTR